MQVQTNRRFLISLDEDEAEELLDDATALQAKIREQLRASNLANANGNGHHATTTTDRNALLTSAVFKGKRSFRNRNTRKSKLPKASGKGRRPMQKTPCPECGMLKPPHWLARHRLKAHGVAPTVEVASPG